MRRRVFAIVEGHGEVDAVPVLLRRIFAELGATDVDVLPPWRLPRSSMLNAPSERARVGRAARLKAGPGGLVLMLLDADDDLPCALGPRLSEVIAQEAAGPATCVVATREFEAWFLAGVETLSGVRGLPARLEAPPDPERIRDAKGWFTERMAPARRYAPPTDQPAFAARFDLVRARERSRSLDKLYRELQRWLEG